MLSWCICIWLCQFEVPRVNLLRLCSCMEALKDLQVYEWTVLPLRSSSWVACACHSRWQSLVGMAKTAKFASQGHRKSSCQKGRWMADFSLSSFQFSLIWMYPGGQKPTSADHLVQGSFTRLIDIQIELLCLGSTWFNYQDKICEQDWARFTKCKDLKSEARFLLSNRPTRQGQQCLRPKDLDTSPGWAGVGRTDEGNLCKWLLEPIDYWSPQSDRRFWLSLNGRWWCGKKWSLGLIFDHHAVLVIGRFRFALLSHLFKMKR